MDISHLKKTESKQLKNSAIVLQYMLEYCELRSDGLVEEKRKRIEVIENLTVYIYSNDHHPPHFHVIYQDKSASYKICDCSVLKGSLGNRNDKIVLNWYNRIGRSKLEQEWKNLRPGEIIIGQYTE